MNPRSVPTNPIPCDAPQEIDLRAVLAEHELELPAHFFCMRLTIDDTHLSTIIPHVTNLEYVRWLEVVAGAHAESLGYDDPWYIEHNLIWFVGRHEIDYLAELFQGDQLLLATWVEEISKYRASRRCAAYRLNDGRLVSRARTDWVLVSRDKHRPIRVPEGMVERFQPLRLPDGRRPASR